MGRLIALWSGHSRRFGEVLVGETLETEFGERMTEQRKRELAAESPVAFRHEPDTAEATEPAAEVAGTAAESVSGRRKLNA